MSKSIEEKRKYFKDSIYLKYEKFKCNEIEEAKPKKKSRLISLQKVAVILIVATLSVTAYAGISGNLNMEKMGFLKLSENYENSRIEVNKSIENEYCNITLESMAGDKAYIIAEYKIQLKDKAFEKMKKPIEYVEGRGYDLNISEKISVNSKEIRNVGKYVDKIAENEYVYTQVINIMDVNKNNLNLEIAIDRISSGTIYGFESEYNEAIQIGKTIKSEIELKGNETVSTISEQKVDDYTKVIIEEIANTKFQTYIKAKKVVSGITYKQFNENPMEYNSFLITDENDNSISKIMYDGNTAGKKWYVNKNETLEETLEYEIKESDEIMQEENFIILISSENDSNKLKITPVKSRIFEDRKVNENGETEEKEMYNKATWYPVKVGDTKYFAKSGLGGTFTIERIDANDENIVFYYNENGSLGDEWRVIIREKIDDMNYIHPVEEEIKGVNSKENRIIFSRNTYMAAGLNLHKMSLDNLDNLEFTLLFGCVTEKVGETANLEIPTEDNQTAEIKNLEIIDFVE